MTQAIDFRTIKTQLTHRQTQLHRAIESYPDAGQLTELLNEVDRALDKVHRGVYGICEICDEPIGDSNMAIDPLLRNCIDHLSEQEQRTLERDLDLAFEIQSGLLPKKDFVTPEWEIAYHYEAAGPVSGDYCDVITPHVRGESAYFLIGDVMGKGVAASILMAHIHASVRSFIPSQFPSHTLIERTNQVFCQGTIPTHFATLVAVHASDDGSLDISNAGHCPPILLRESSVLQIPSTGLPIGLFKTGKYGSQDISMNSGDVLILYSDGVTEAWNEHSVQYGEARLIASLMKDRRRSSREIIARCLGDLQLFRNGAARIDDITLMVIRKR